MKHKKKRLVWVLISKLRPHPKQATLFATCSEDEIKALAESMDKEGQNEPVEILPDHTLICGHQRVHAAKVLGWTKVLCWVRDDLAKAGDDAVEKRLIEDNLLRRQLSKLDVARCYLRIKELEHEGWAAEEHAQQDFRDYIGDRFSVKGRTLDRWASILRAPMPVQCAYDDKLLAESSAIKIATKLDEEIQAKLAKKIEAARKKGGTPEEIKQRIAGIVAKHFPRNSRPKSLHTGWRHLRKALSAALETFEGETITFGIDRQHRDLLVSAIGLLRDLRRVGKKNEEDADAAMRDYLDGLQNDGDEGGETL